MSDPSRPEVWRTGRSVGRTVYRQRGDDPAKGDQLIGMMDTPELAALVVTAVNTLNAGGRGDVRQHR